VTLSKTPFCFLTNILWASSNQLCRVASNHVAGQISVISRINIAPDIGKSDSPAHRTQWTRRTCLQSISNVWIRSGWPDVLPDATGLTTWRKQELQKRFQHLKRATSWSTQEASPGCKTWRSDRGPRQLSVHRPLPWGREVHD